MKVIYELKKHRKLIKMVQKATLETKKYGIVQEHGLFGSPEWWASIKSGLIPLHSLEGKISRVFMSGHGDFPEFEVDDGKEKSTWERKGHDWHYKVGKQVRIEYVMTKNRFDHQRSPSVVRVLMSK